MNTPETPDTTLEQVFGHEEFLPGQRQVIEAVLDGRSALAVFPTGQGKSLCYQLPALHLPGLTLVVSPLMALMKDQVDTLLTKNIPAARLDSSLSFNEIQDIYTQLDQGTLKLLFVAPERFANERFVNLMQRLDISLMAIDEAHCISEWGHNFRPDYLKLAELAAHLSVGAVLALTATATPQVCRDIQQVFQIADQDVIKTGFYRPNLTLLFDPAMNRDQDLAARLTGLGSGPAIVYVTLQKTAEQVARRLVHAGLEARPYHAGLGDEKRRETQEWFMASTDGVVVATIAFGMGIDKPDIRSVIHYNLPKSLENYAQEIGRAGRDGEPSTCLVLGREQDRISLENFIYGDTPEPDQVQACIDHLLDQPDRFSCSIHELAHTFDMRPLVIKTLLTYLELEEVIRSTGPFYSEYLIKPQKSSAEILSRFDPARQEFLRQVFSCAQKRKTWFAIDLDQAVAKTGSPRKRIVTALDYLEQCGDLKLKVSGARLGFRRLDTGQRDLDALKQDIGQRFLMREENDCRRIDEVIGLIQHQGCKTRHLLQYFGEDLDEDCGHCSFCTGKSGAEWPEAEQEWHEPDQEIIARLNQLRQDHPDALATPRQVARFLCGISSPRLIRARLTRDSMFALLSEQRFKRVMEWAGELPSCSDQHNSEEEEQL